MKKSELQATELHKFNDDLDTEEPGDSEALRLDTKLLGNLRNVIECYLAGFMPEDGPPNHTWMVIAASHEIQRQVDAARDAEDERDRMAERVRVLEGEREALLRVAREAETYRLSTSPSFRGLCDALIALPEHVRREL